MRRAIHPELVEWYKRQPTSARKPLILRGARQVGKSYVVRDFCRREGLQCLEINFERDPALAQFFVDGPNARTLSLLSTHFKMDLGPSTLLFLDEIQAAPHVFSRLRYFFEESSEIPVIAAGSLLEFALTELASSVPVGRLEYMYLGPMRFEELLDALGEQRLLQTLREWNPLGEAFAAPLHTTLLEKVNLFSITGGMPESVDEAVRTGQVHRCVEIQRAILTTYSQDFAKYRKRIPIERLQRVLDAIPAQVGKKWVHSRVSPHDKASSIQSALDALCLAQVAHRVHHSSGNGVPLNAEANDKFFKVLFLDVGLMANRLGLDLTVFQLGDTLDSVAQGALAEQWIGQHLLDLRPLSQAPQLHYWVREKKGANAEVDYLISQGRTVLPVEVKSGSSQRAKSLQVFLKEKNKTPFAVHFSNALPHWDAELRVLRLPFYMVEQLPRLAKALTQPEEAGS